MELKCLAGFGRQEICMLSEPRKSTGPSVEGPPSCEASSIQYAGSSVCISLHPGYPFNPACLTVEWGPGRTPATTHRPCCLPLGSDGQSSNFKPVSNASKVIKIGPEASQKLQKVKPGIRRSPTSLKCCFFVTLP